VKDQIENKINKKNKKRPKCGGWGQPTYLGLSIFFNEADKPDFDHCDDWKIKTCFFFT